MATYIREPIAVYLRQDQYDELQVRARQQGVSIADLIRTGVDTLLAHASPVETPPTEAPPDADPFRDIIGMIDSGLDDLAENHDRYLAEFEMESNRRWHEKSS